MNSLRPCILGCLFLLTPLLGGCALLGGGVEPQTREKLAALRYPEEAPYGPDLDIRLLREGDTLRLVNREARVYEDAQMWLNRQYVRPIEQIAIGDDTRYELSRFINGYEESFPLGELLAPEQAREVVLGELYDPEANIRHRLTVQPKVDRDLLELATDVFLPQGK